MKDLKEEFQEHIDQLEDKHRDIADDVAVRETYLEKVKTEINKYLQKNEKIQELTRIEKQKL